MAYHNIYFKKMSSKLLYKIISYKIRLNKARFYNFILFYFIILVYYL